jgi:OHCU decarboxylase
MTLAKLNSVPRYRAEDELLQCCGSRAWARALAGRRPFANLDRLLRASTDVWWELDETDWREAFAAHPRIGGHAAATHAAARTQAWSAQEQSGVNRGSVKVMMDLEQANREYFDRFDYIFIICASGKSVDEMLGILQSRLANSPEQEIRIAAEEQDKITRLRLEKLIRT